MHYSNNESWKKKVHAEKKMGTMSIPWPSYDMSLWLEPTLMIN